MTAGNKYWPTKDEDMEIIIRIIQRHSNGNQIPAFFENCKFDDEKESVAIKFPPWVKDMTEYLKMRHGETRGMSLVSMVYEELGLFPKAHHC